LELGRDKGARPVALGVVLDQDFQGFFVSISGDEKTWRLGDEPGKSVMFVFTYTTRSSSRYMTYQINVSCSIEGKI
jgi:hypothetical protein